MKYFTILLFLMSGCSTFEYKCKWISPENYKCEEDDHNDHSGRYSIDRLLRGSSK